MVQIIILDKAQEDLEEIAEYWAKFSVNSARQRLDEIYDKIRLLESFSRLGKVYEELNYPKVREIVAGPYRVIYHIVSETKIHILTIHNSKVPLDWEDVKPN